VNEETESTINEVKADLERPAKPKPKGAKKVAKKVKKASEEDESPKGKVKKKGKAKANGNATGGHKEEDGLITVADLAAEAEISPQSARVKLRAAELDRGEGRWKWEEGSKALKQARKVLGLDD
jgi:hypothetical protein